MPADESEAVGVLDRMTSILEAFDEDDRGLGLSELASRAALPKSTVSRLVATLVRQRYLERDGKQIHLGLRLFELGRLATEPRELRVAALPVMAELRHSTGQNVHLAMRDGHELICVGSMKAQAAEPVIARIGARLPLHATALGKAVLAHSPAGFVDEVVGSELTAWTGRTIVDADQLRRQLMGVRLRGLAVDVREFSADASCVASPVFSPAGELVAAISVSGPAESFSPDRLGPAVRAAALAVTRRLSAGGRASG